MRTAKYQDKPYKITDGGGLYLLVNTNGSRYWRLKYRVMGREKLLSIGFYPDECDFHNNNLCAQPAQDIAMQEVTEGLLHRVQSYPVRVEDDAMLEASGLYTPSFNGLGRQLIDSPVARNQFYMKIAARRKVKGEAENTEQVEKGHKP